MNTREVLKARAVKCASFMIQDEDAAKVAAVLLERKVWFEATPLSVGGGYEFFVEASDQVKAAIKAATAKRNPIAEMFRRAA
jgi:hypothetical protein